jgi:hypothetical protein
VRGRLLWFVGGLALGCAALARVLRPKRSAEPLQEGPDPRAAELRRKLAESRTIVAEREEFEAGETTVDEAEPGPEVDDRRRRVHEEGRAAARRMRRPPASS